jgi:UDP-N-acetylmuramoyl-L-alanyl-D-glutamate--2,6-diaminopimelate ligase
MEDYFEAKRLLFKSEKRDGASYPKGAAINIDDPKGEELTNSTGSRVLSYGLGSKARVTAKDIEINADGLEAILICPYGEAHFKSALLGRLNMYNILAASAAALSLGIPLSHIITGITHARKVPGRLEPVDCGLPFKVIVDYAHTPDALRKVLDSLRHINRGRVITVFGCGGDRDRTKRAMMGRIAGKGSDIVVITSDNPRSEDPGIIASEIEKGVLDSGMKSLSLTDLCSNDSIDPSEVPGRTVEKGYILELDRAAAILCAINIADEGDLVLIAGKGHEDYQIVGEDRRHFDDRETALAAAERRKVFRGGKTAGVFE